MFKNAAVLMGIFLTTLNAHADLSFAVVSDAGIANETQRQVRDSIDASGVRKLIMAGDNIYEDVVSSYDAVWESWKTLGFTFDVTAIGNHSLGYENEVAYFGMPNQYYSKVYRDEGVRFIVLNSDNKDKTFLESQREWFEHEIEAANERNVFLVYHHPSYTLSAAHPASQRKKFQAYVRPVLAQYREKITALIVGHDHLALVAHFDDLPVILSGATQEIDGERPSDQVEEGVQVKTNWFFNGNPHWLRLDTSSSSAGQITGTFIDAQNERSECSFTLRTGYAASLGPNC